LTVSLAHSDIGAFSASMPQYKSLKGRTSRVNPSTSEDILRRFKVRDNTARERLVKNTGAGDELVLAVVDAEPRNHIAECWASKNTGLSIESRDYVNRMCTTGFWRRHVDEATAAGLRTTFRGWLVSQAPARGSARETPTPWNGNALLPDRVPPCGFPASAAPCRHLGVGEAERLDICRVHSESADEHTTVDDCDRVGCWRSADRAKSGSRDAGRYCCCGQRAFATLYADSRSITARLHAVRRARRAM